MEETEDTGRECLGDGFAEAGRETAADLGGDLDGDLQGAQAQRTLSIPRYCISHSEQAVSWTCTQPTESIETTCMFVGKHQPTIAMDDIYIQIHLAMDLCHSYVFE